MALKRIRVVTCHGGRAREYVADNFRDEEAYVNPR